MSEVLCQACKKKIAPVTYRNGYWICPNCKHDIVECCSESELKSENEKLKKQQIEYLKEVNNEFNHAINVIETSPDNPAVRLHGMGHAQCALNLLVRLGESKPEQHDLMANYFLKLIEEGENNESASLLRTLKEENEELKEDLETHEIVNKRYAKREINFQKENKLLQKIYEEAKECVEDWQIWEDLEVAIEEYETQTNKKGQDESKTI